MKTDNLKSLFENNEINNLHDVKGGQVGPPNTSERTDTNIACTGDDIGCCDTDVTMADDYLDNLGTISTNVDHVPQID